MRAIAKNYCLDRKASLTNLNGDFN
jgi:hypothetical protein